MQRRMSLRGDLPHSVVDVLSEPSLDWLIEASLPLPLATVRKSGSCNGFSTLSVPYSPEARETCIGYKYPAATGLRSHS